MLNNADLHRELLAYYMFLLACRWSTVTMHFCFSNYVFQYGYYWQAVLSIILTLPDEV
jgi:hypothetical protein